MFVSSLNPTWVDNAEGEVSAQSVAAIGRVHARVRRCCRVDPFCFADNDFDRSDRVKKLEISSLTSGSASACRVAVR
jgi:hypothetical protein